MSVPLTPHHKCHLCGAPSRKLCSRCSAVRYCGRRCQKKDWARHKRVCKRVWGCVCAVTLGHSCERDCSCMCVCVCAHDMMCACIVCICMCVCMVSDVMCCANSYNCTLTCSDCEVNKDKDKYKYSCGGKKRNKDKPKDKHKSKWFDLSVIRFYSIQFNNNISLHDIDLCSLLTSSLRRIDSRSTELVMFTHSYVIHHTSYSTFIHSYIVNLHHTSYICMHHISTHHTSYLIHHYNIS